jgi:hypothetical protein
MATSSLSAFRDRVLHPHSHRIRVRTRLFDFTGLHRRPAPSSSPPIRQSTGPSTHQSAEPPSHPFSSHATRSGRLPTYACVLRGRPCAFIFPVILRVHLSRHPARSSFASSFASSCTSLVRRAGDPTEPGTRFGWDRARLCITLKTRKNPTRAAREKARVRLFPIPEMAGTNPS